MREVALTRFIYLYTMCAADFAITVLDLERNICTLKEIRVVSLWVWRGTIARIDRVSTSERQVCHIEDDNPRAGH